MGGSDCLVSIFKSHSSWKRLGMEIIDTGLRGEIYARMTVGNPGGQAQRRGLGRLQSADVEYTLIGCKLRFKSEQYVYTVFLLTFLLTRFRSWSPGVECPLPDQRERVYSSKMVTWRATDLRKGGKPQSSMYVITPAAQTSTFRP